MQPIQRLDRVDSYFAPLGIDMLGVLCTDLYCGTGIPSPPQLKSQFWLLDKKNCKKNKISNNNLII